jgi:transcriptional regulator with XRE-family HTH domain
MQAQFIISRVDAYNDGMKTGRPAKSERSEFGARLHALREAAGLSQAQVADKLGIKQPTYALWERRTTAISATQLQQLADAFGVGIDALFIDARAAARRANGPTGKARALFERVSTLPRTAQQRILSHVEDSLTAYEVRKTS